MHEANNASVTSTIVETATATAVSSAPGQTSTQDITLITQLPASTSYATMTIGTQTVTNTLSMATGKEHPQNDSNDRWLMMLLAK